MMKLTPHTVVVVLLIGALAFVPANRAQAPATNVRPTFEKDVQPVFVQVCSNCHNDKLSSGGLNMISRTC